MPAAGSFTLGKEERICSRKLIETLFRGGDSRAASCYPLRTVYLPMQRTAGEPQALFMVSVPKRLLKRAVDRNRVKRQVREAYRLNKHTVLQQLASQPGRKVLMAFIWQDSRLRDTAEVENSVKRLLQRVSEKL